MFKLWKLISKTICSCLALVVFSACGNTNAKYVIGVSQCSEDNWREKMNDEMLSSAYAEGDITLDIVSAADDNELQERQITEFVEKGVDLIVVAPNQTIPISSALQKAKRKGIPVICVDRKAEEFVCDAFIGADNENAGRSVGQFLVSRLKGKGVVVEFGGLAGSSPASERNKGFLEALRNSPGIKVVNGGSTDWTTEGAERTIEAFIHQHPDVRPDAIFGHNDRIAVAAKKLYKRHGIDVISVGVDALPTPDGGLRKVANGELEASYLYPTRGDLIIKLAKKVLEGEKIEKDTYLSSALITRENAEAVLTQIDDMQQMQQRITTLNSQINGFLRQINNQRLMFMLALVIVLLLISFGVYVFREELAKRKRSEAETNERLRFFTNVSHEFRTPLTLIADPLDRIDRSRELSGNNARLLSLAKRQVDVMLGLVSTLLDLRKVQDNKMSLHPQEVDIAKTFRLWVEGFKPMAETKGVGIRLSAPQQLIVTVDTDKLERISYNLLSNALKYSPPSTVVEVSLASHSDHFVFMVNDQGKGLTEEEVSRIFIRFYQAPSSVSGTGIGLALAKELVDMMGGSIDVKSIPHEGTSFKVSIPTAIQKVSDEKQEKYMFVDPVEVKADAITVSEKETDNLVLVVDDNADVRTYLRDTLQQEGYKVIEANDGVSGLRSASENVPDIIVSDVMMPVMGGHELCRQLKSQTVTSHIPVIMLTAQAMDDQRMEGYDVGVDAYITKPFSSRVLLSRVRNLLKNRLLLKVVFSGEGTEPDISKKDTHSTELTGKNSQEETNGDDGRISMESAFLTSFKEQVEQHMTESGFSVETLAANLNLSRVQMYRKIKAITGQNPVELIREARLLRADDMLRTGRYTISEVAYCVGFSSPSYFSKCYKQQFGHTPGEK